LALVSKVNPGWVWMEVRRGHPVQVSSGSHREVGFEKEGKEPNTAREGHPSQVSLISVALPKVVAGWKEPRE